MATQGNRYEIKHALQRGGMGVVFRAYDTYRGHDVALKMLPPSFLNEPDFRRRFTQETQTIIQLEHHAIVPVYDYGEQDEQPYISMRLMGGGTLEDRLAKGPLSFAEMRQIMRRICSALDYAHQRNIIHRDLKPKNILFDEQGAVYLVDFGIAKLVQGTHTATFAGTAQYMAPEQVNGETLSPQTDIYQMGVVLFEMLTGEVPFSGSMSQVIIKHVTASIPSVLERNRHLPAACETIIQQAMSKKKEQRHESAGALALALDQALTPTQTSTAAQTVTTAVFDPAPQPAPPPVKQKVEELVPTILDAPQPQPQSRKWMIWLVGGVLALLLSWAGFQFIGGGVNAESDLEPTAVLEAIPLEVTKTVTPTEQASATILPSATPQPDNTSTSTPTATPTATATATTPATATPMLSPTASQTATQQPTATTAPATATPIPATPTIVTQAPSVNSLSGGEQQNPIAFSWNGNQTLSYRVLLRHVEQGFTHNSGWIQGLTWTFDIPAEQFGVWEWVVEASNGTRSGTDSFIFNPFPNSSGGGDSSGGGGTPDPQPTNPIPDA